jgi:hypothetical protein
MQNGTAEVEDPPRRDAKDAEDREIKDQTAKIKTVESGESG